MGADSKIEWTHHTFNPWRGCTKVSAGCANCYAETLSHRNPKALGEWGPNGKRVIAADAYWRLPIRWNREAREAGERRRVFCASLADVFEEREELVEPRRRLFMLIGNTPHLDWLLLTKRPHVAVEHWPLWCGYWASVQENSAVVKSVATSLELPNVWVGTSVEDQAAADQRIPELLKIPAAVRFLSCEPLLGPINLPRVKLPGAGFIDAFDGRGHDGSPTGGRDFKDDSSIGSIDWVIVGGESGPGARPMHPDWPREVCRDCVAAGVPFFFKQWGEWKPISDMPEPEYQALYVSNRKAAQGEEWRQGDLDEFHGRRCTVESRVVRYNGDVCDFGDGVAFRGINGHLGYQIFRVGKKAAGRLLDGREWNEFPSSAAPAAVEAR